MLIPTLKVLKSTSLISFYFLILFVFSSKASYAQSKQIDSLKSVLQRSKHDTTSISALNQLANLLLQENPNEAVQFLIKANKLAEKNSKVIGIQDFEVQNLSRKLYLKKNADILSKIGTIYENNGENKKALIYYFKSLTINNELKDKSAAATTLRNIGRTDHTLGQTQDALNYYQRSLDFYKALNDKMGVAKTLNNIALVYEDQGRIKDAITYYQNSLKIFEEINARDCIGGPLSNIGDLYSHQGQKKEALNYYKRSLKIFEEQHEKRGIALSLNNIGNVLENNGQTKEALDYFLRSLKLFEEIKLKEGIAICYNNIGNIYNAQGNINGALDYYNRCLKLSEATDDKRGIVSSCINISNTYIFKKDFNEALKYSSRSLRLSKELGFPNLIKEAAYNLEIIYEKQNNTKLALEMYALYITMRDSISNEENRKASYKSLLDYEYSKKTLADSLRSLGEKKIASAKLAESQANLKLEKTQKIALYVIVLISLILALAQFFNYRLKTRSNKLLSAQKEQIEQKNLLLETQKNAIEQQNLLLENNSQLITDSIEYAKKIQESMLPNKEVLLKYFSDAFVYYQPKDIVSGDFYWLRETPLGIALAVADCTGHGVAGALMSVLGHNSLDTAYQQLSDLSPANVLRYTDNYIKQKTRNQNSANGNVDGMALTLVDYTTSEKKLVYSAANQYVYLVRNKELVEIKGNGFSIGSLQLQDINQGELLLQKNDMLYLFTDGYADQKGGPEKRKFMYPNLKKLVIKISELSGNDQLLNLKREMDNWKGKLSQVDDILVVGLKI